MSRPLSARPSTRVHHLARLFVTVAVLSLTLQAARAAGEPCGPASPAVNKPGFMMGATVPWTTGPSPGGAPFPEEMRACVARAFDAWTAANQAAGSDVRFISGEGGLVVRFDKPGGLILTGRQAGAWTDGVRGSDGGLERACIWITSNPALVAACDAVTKIVMHELGHLHGLADNRFNRGPSVMNRAGGPDDLRGRLPAAPTECDAGQAAAASRATARRVLSLARQNR
jgi:hypothetical protein